MLINNGFDSILSRIAGFQQPSDQKKSWGHRLVAGWEAIPVFLSASINQVGFLARQLFLANPPKVDKTEKSFCWHPRALGVDVAMQKMWKNAGKAVKEHQAGESSGVYIASCAFLEANEQPLNFAFFEAEAQGPRPTMEDAHFFKRIEQGVLTGVFDGHGGQEVAKYASEMFQKKFSAVLAKSHGQVHQAFEELIHEIHQEIAKKQDWSFMGSTAVVCFVDEDTQLIYTATLGDSEANIYRETTGGMKSIPLSCVRDWSSTKDAARAAQALGYPQIADEWPKAENPKALRYPHPHYGINVSRALGDVSLTGTEERPGVIHKPKITVNRLQVGDKLILACDGLKDYVPEDEIAKLVALNAAHENLAERLVQHAVNVRRAKDNVTVLAVNVT